MRYTDDIIEEVRSRNNIVDVVSEYVRLQKKGSSYFGLCPFHNEKSPSFSVSPSKQMFYCFGCGVGGNVYTFLMEYENATFPEAIQKLADRAGIELPKQEYSKEEKQQADVRSSLLAINKAAAQFYYYQLRTDRGRDALAYLKNRQLSDETMKKFGLGYAGRYSGDLYRYLKSKKYPDELLKQSGLFNMDEKRGMTDKFWNRVIFPIMDVNQKVIGFGGRVMGDAKPKYLNSPETMIFDKSRSLYGLHIARSSRRKNLIICEGYMDVISMHQAGFDNAVASLGTSLTSGQCSLMKRFTNEVLVIYDSDGAGQKAALRAIPLLKEAGLATKVINLRPYKDPDEFIKALGAEKFEERLQQGTNGFMYEIDTLQQSYDMKDPQGKTDFFHETARRLCRFSDEMERNNYMEAIAEHFGIDLKVLRRQVNSLALKGVGQAPRSENTGQALPKQKKVPPKTSMAQRLMLTWLCSYPAIYQDVRKYISVDDFTDPLCAEVARLMFQMYDEGKNDPSGILDHFQDIEEQKSVAAILHARLQLESETDRQKALADVICRMKEESLKKKSSLPEAKEAAGFMELLKEKKALEELNNHKQNIKIQF